MSDLKQPTCLMNIPLIKYKTANILSIMIEKYDKYAKILTYGRTSVTIYDLLWKTIRNS